MRLRTRARSLYGIGTVALALVAATLACRSASPPGDVGLQQDRAPVHARSGPQDLPSAIDARAAPAAAIPGGVGSRVFVVERESQALAVYDLATRQLLPRRITGLGDLRHAVMSFSPDLPNRYLATRGGKLSRIDLATLERHGEVFTSQDSIDIAISQDGRYIATAEYLPGGVTILGARDLEIQRRLEATFELEGETRPSRVTGIVDAGGDRFVCVLMEGREIWIINAHHPGFPIEHRIPTAAEGMPYDAMITPDGRHYLVGHLDSGAVSLLDLDDPRKGARSISLRDPSREYARDTPVKLPHMASWAVARGRVFVPLVGERRLAVLDRDSWELEASVPLRGHPVYAVRSPSEREVWVSFSGEADDSWVQVVDTQTLEVKKSIQIGGRIYHMAFTPRGSHVLVSANRDDTLALVDATTYAIEDTETVRSPSGIFGAWRAFRLGL